MGSAISINHRRRSRTLHQNFEKADPDDDDSLIAGQCLRVKFKRRRHKQRCESLPPDQKKVTTMVRSLTLREWILSSPGREPEGINGGESCMFSPLFTKVFPSSPEVYETSISMTGSPCKARDSLSLERPLKISGEDDSEGGQEEGAVSAASICRTQSGGSTRRVRFRSPKEADIYIFYSPKDDEY